MLLFSETSTLYWHQDPIQEQFLIIVDLKKLSSYEISTYIKEARKVKVYGCVCMLCVVYGGHSHSSVKDEWAISQQWE